MHGLTEKLAKISAEDPKEGLPRLYSRVFNSPDGELVLEDLRNRFFYYAPALTPHDEGGRRVVLHIQGMIKRINEERAKKGDPNAT